MVEKILKHRKAILLVCVVMTVLALGYSWATTQFLDGVSADIVEIRILKNTLSQCIRESNIEFARIEACITTLTLKATAAMISLDRCAYALEVSAGIEE